MPPARGIMAASSPKARAPTIVRNPVAIQVIRSPAGEPSCRATSAETMKMPEPIMEPITSIVASRRPSPWTSSTGRGGSEGWRSRRVMLESVSCSSSYGRSSVMAPRRQRPGTSATSAMPAAEAKPIPAKANHMAWGRPRVSRK